MCVKTLSCRRRRRRDDAMSDVPSHDFKVDGARAAARLINRREVPDGCGRDYNNNNNNIITITIIMIVGKKLVRVLPVAVAVS